MNFDYYYGDESNQFAFYRIPRQLITGEAFKKLSTDAKLLYGLLLDRMGLSAKNGWYDAGGEAFDIDLSGAALPLLDPLNEAEAFLAGVQLCQEPDRLFMAARHSQTSDFRKSRLRKSRSQEFRKTEVKTSGYRKCRLPKIGHKLY